LSHNQDNRYALVVKKDCPTCALIEPVLQTLLANLDGELEVYVQDDPGFPASIPERIDDTALAWSYSRQIEIVPTLLRLRSDGLEVSRIVG